MTAQNSVGVQVLQFVFGQHDFLDTKQSLFLHLRLRVHHQPHDKLLPSELCSQAAQDSETHLKGQALCMTMPETIMQHAEIQQRHKCAFRPGSLMGLIWLPTPDCKNY